MGQLAKEKIEYMRGIRNTEVEEGKRVQMNK